VRHPTQLPLHSSQVSSLRSYACPRGPWNWCSYAMARAHEPLSGLAGSRRQCKQERHREELFRLAETWPHTGTPGVGEGSAEFGGWGAARGESHVRLGHMKD
jgi:hypothetical protein